jgi:hypothetical protein
MGKTPGNKSSVHDGSRSSRKPVEPDVPSPVRKTAKVVYACFAALPSGEKAKFFRLVQEGAMAPLVHRPRHWLTLQEAAEELEVNRSTVWRAIRRKELLTNGKARKNCKVLVFSVMQIQIQKLQVLGAGLVASTGGMGQVAESASGLQHLATLRAWVEEKLGYWRPILLPRQL